MVPLTTRYFCTSCAKRPLCRAAAFICQSGHSAKQRRIFEHRYALQHKQIVLLRIQRPSLTLCRHSLLRLFSSLPPNVKQHEHFHATAPRRLGRYLQSLCSLIALLDVHSDKYDLAEPLPDNRRRDRDHSSNGTPCETVFDSDR